MKDKLKIILTIQIICSALLMLACTNPALEHLRQGDTYRDQEQWSEAISEYSKAIEVDPGLALAYSARGLAYIEIEQYDLSIADFNKVIELSIDPEMIQLAEERMRAAVAQ